MLSPQAALIHAMVAAARSDDPTAEQRIGLIGELVEHLPMFEGIDRRQVVKLARVCCKRLAGPDGVDETYRKIRAALPGPLREAAYALSCDVVATGCRSQGDMIQALAQIRARLEIDPARAQMIERVARRRAQAA